MEWKTRLLLFVLVASLELLLSSRTEAFAPPRSIIRNNSPRLSARGGVNGEEEEEERKGFRAKFQIGNNKNKNDVVAAKPEEEGFFRGIISKRLLPGRKNKDDVGVVNGVKIREDPTAANLVEGMFEGVDEFRKRIGSIRAAENLEESIRSGVLLSTQEATKRLSELKTQIDVNRKKQVQLIAARKEVAKEESKCNRSGDDKRSQALAKAKQLVDQKIERSKKLNESYQRQQQLVRIASGKLKAPKSLLEKLEKKGSSGGPTAKRKQQQQQPTKQQSSPPKEKNPVKNVLQSSPLVKEETSNKGGGGFNLNPVSGAQKLVSNVFDSFSRREQWVVAFPKRRIDPGEVVPVQVAGIDLLVVATRDGKKLYALANSCSHLGTPLETGMVESRGDDESTKEECIICPLHQTAFSMESGEVIGEWCPYPPMLGTMMGAVKKTNPIAVFDIRTRGKNIEIKINSSVEDLYKDDEPKQKQKQ